ncbi:hypothetical protein [Hyphomicrobium sp.]|uniref:hypothetical protein n=1 Tax=Hyphomicrobium sp. TaxID=82 RepID=UPI002B527BF7|nr:hypothetical protein [Hyphomicrobium sp.]HRQ25804.1 hypothetical protein [Hyphomicrobium sp.]
MDIFDLSDLNAPEAFETGMEIDILHPVTSEPTGLKVKVRSFRSRRVEEIEHDIANKVLRKRSRDSSYVKTAWEMHEDATKILAATVVSWSGFEMNGEPLECTNENVTSVLGNRSLWFIRDQIDKAASDDRAFWATKAHEKTAAPPESDPVAIDASGADCGRPVKGKLVKATA